MSDIFFALHIFLTIFVWLNFSFVFKERQPRRSSENNLERNWCLRETTSSTNDYIGQQQMSFDQPSKCNYRKQYQQNINPHKTSSFNTYRSKKL